MGNVSMDLVQDMFEDKKACISKGKVLADVIQSRTDSLAHNVKLVEETESWRVMYVKQSKACRPVDLMHYQKRLDELISVKPTLVLTQDEQALPSGLYNLGLRRAGDNLDVSKVAANLKLCEQIVSGGGHPFAGGVQSHQELEQQVVKEIAVKAKRQLLSASDETPSKDPTCAVDATQSPKARENIGTATIPVRSRSHDARPSRLLRKSVTGLWIINVGCILISDLC